jgi:CRP/FNR family transcriptional regulator
MAMSVSASEMQKARQSVAPFLIRRSEAVQARAGLKDDADAAIDLHRRSVAGFASRNPLQRIASLLIAISHNNEYEGRDPRAVPDTLTSGFVAELLGIEVRALADLLQTLEHQGFVAAVPAVGLKLTNLAGLERLADAH